MAPKKPSKPDLTHTHPDTGVVASVRIGDCREKLPDFDEVKNASVDLIFADPPFNWARDYDRHQTGDAWDDSAMSREQYLAFTEDWLNICAEALAPHGSMWVNIPDDSAAEIVVHLKKIGLHMVNWCVWHYRFGQNTKGRFINSKVHALYFCKDPANRIWNPEPVLEVSDRRAVYGDPRTENKRDGMPAGMRVPMDVWYGKYWGRIQGNNKERRAKHDNQLPEAYLHRVIASCSNEGDTVLDPFLGSGTTGVVAHAMGRNFIGTEYSKANAEMAFERVVSGPIRDLDAFSGDSTAIFEKRRQPKAPAIVD
ncbi:MAG TPA: site-specific DNA-methyltransferase [Phycisphaerales bacterium]|nr:site-specific DNA-methyltransferase [Phycisphaerae bacterium]HCT44522.1 site-specific DNA-methyltransferase [Phycisphaerales bacterium]